MRGWRNCSFHRRRPAADGGLAGVAGDVDAIGYAFVGRADGAHVHPASRYAPFNQITADGQRAMQRQPARFRPRVGAGRRGVGSELQALIVAQQLLGKIVEIFLPRFVDVHGTGLKRDKFLGRGGA